ncbi:hypothetical protein [Paracraurococcus lichenis]|uniref:Uncharacterized protein n=1 Tax=Paracraurococcus lichenis TaxID=3064888 RepID=A0ABT9DXV8_9PROT|nr:hypothetical protein [Paracraurococcus sp. LOR1-02]MDO9708736.1 hypothetical protein [Paracraurococcus sp. LOR1-02]
MPPRPEGGARAPRRLLDAALASLPAARGRAALLLPPAPRLVATPARWRLAEAVLEDAAATGGGTLLRSAGGGTLLLGASPSAARRAAEALGRLMEEAGGLPVWHLPQETEAVLTWAALEAPAPIPMPPPPAPVAGLHPALDGLTADAVLRADLLLPPEGPAAGRRLRLSRSAIAAAIGPAAADPDLLAHAGERMAARLLPGLAAWACDLPGLRLIPVSRDRLPAPARQPGAVAVLPLAVLVDPGLAGLRRRLAERGWGLGFAGLEAGTLRVLDPRRLAADLLLLRWSPALAEGAPAAALRALGPGRVVLTGTGEGPGTAFAREAGLLLARPA